MQCIVEFRVLSHRIADRLEAGAPAGCPSSSRVVSHILLAKAPMKIQKWKCKSCLICTAFTLLWSWGCSPSNPHQCGHCLYLTVLPLSTPSVSICLPSWAPRSWGNHCYFLVLADLQVNTMLPGVAGLLIQRWGVGVKWCPNMGDLCHSRGAPC